MRRKRDSLFHHKCSASYQEWLIMPESIMPDLRFWECFLHASRVLLNVNDEIGKLVKCGRVLRDVPCGCQPYLD